MKTFRNQLILCVGAALVGLSLSSCSGGGGGESGENGDFSQDGSSGGVPAPSQLKAGQTIEFRRSASIPGFSMSTAYSIKGSSRADKGGSRGVYTYTAHGSSATFRFSMGAYAPNSSLLSSYSETYNIKFTSPTSGVIISSTVSGVSDGVAQSPTTLNGGTFEIR